MLQFLSHIYSGCGAREGLHRAYLSTLVLHIDKSSILLIGKLKPKKRQKLLLSQTQDETRTKVSKMLVKGYLPCPVLPFPCSQGNHPDKWIELSEIKNLLVLVQRILWSPGDGGGG